MIGTFAIATYAIATSPSVTVSVTPEVPVPITLALSSCYGYSTAGDLIRRALHAILVEAADSQLEPDEYQDGLDALNGYLLGLEANGVRLGYQRLCHLTDYVNIPDGALRGLVANLAIDLAPQFGGRVTAALLKQAADGEKTLYRMGVKIGTSLLPGTLPRGSGNYCWPNTFYTPSPYGVMTIAGNQLATNLTTASQARKVAGFWAPQESHLMRPDLSGRMVNTGEGRTFNLYAEFNLKAAGATAGGVVAIARNNAIEMYAEDLALSTDPSSALLQGSIALEAGDFIDVVVADTAGTNTITVIDALVRLD